MKHAWNATEVFRQAKTSRFGKGAAPLAEDRRFGPAEAVDRLFGIPHHEHPARLKRAASQQFKNLALNQVRVLELVDENKLDRPGQSQGRSGSAP